MQTIELPPFWEPLLKRYVKKTFYPGTRKGGFADRGEFTEGDYRFFASGIKKLNLAFTEERHSLPGNYFNQKDLRSGYLLYFLPVNALKVAALLSQSDLPLDPLLCKEGAGGGREFTILDIGSGPGTGMLGTMLWIENSIRHVGATPRGCPEEGGHTGPPLRIHWILLDQNRQTLEDARSLHDEALKQLREAVPSLTIESDLRLVTGNLFTERFSKILAPFQADLILSLNFLSELPRAKRVPIVETLLRDYLRPSGKMLIMEPALRITTRDLMELHDAIVSRESAEVLAPCLHQAVCPMLAANQRDWCHTYIPWGRPPWIEKIDRLVGIRKDYLKCSYLLLGKEAPPAVSSDTWRVVSGHLNSRGKSELLLCGPEGLPQLQRVVRLDRDRSPVNRAFDEVQRGELVKMEKTSRIGKMTTVSNISE